MPDIRLATITDARNLASIAEATFRATFAIDNTAEDMDRYCRNNYSEALQALEIGNPAMLTLLCEEAGQLCGFAQLRWGTAPDCVTGSRPGELQRLYVVESQQGRGVSQQLMQASIEAMQQRGSDCIWLGVWEDNFRALAFYRKAGFVAVGEHVFHLGTNAQRDLLLARPVKGN